jgi:hypothetical protein
MIVNSAYYEDWSLDRMQWVKKLYKKISSVTQDRKNELMKIFNQFQIQFESSIQLSFSTQARSSLSSSITIIRSTSSTQNRISYESRTQYDSDTRQNRYIDIRNQQFAESRHEDRSFNSESRFENRDRQFNFESRQENRSFISESRYDRGSNRLRNRQYELAEYAITKYADENFRSMNLIRRAAQSNYQASEFYVSSSLSEINQSDERIIYAKKLSALNKLYKNEEKFESTENNFDFKLTIYLDKCKFADLSEHAYKKDVSLMLTNETLTYYYVNRDNFITFNDFCTSMRLYFEDSQWQSHNLDKWHSIIIDDVIAINSNVSLTECLRKMCSQTNTIQRDLNPAYHDAIRLRENIIRICRNHSALIFELINSSMNTLTLVNILQSSIINYEIVRKFLAHQQYHQNNEIDDHYFIDRQYRRSEYRDESSSDRRVEFYRDEFRDRSNDKFQSNRRSKKCFVCDKFDCWSINHSDK